MTSQAKRIEVVDWGRLGYGEASHRQVDYAANRAAGKSDDLLILVEHPPVVTIGRSGDEKDLRLPEKMLRDKGIDLHFVERGGKATYHGPGQMVAYPIMKLPDRDVHRYVQNLLRSVADVLETYGLQPTFKDGNPGIWVNGKKIVSIGIAIKNWIAYHGIALNVNPDLSMYQWIVPCGHPDEVMTSMQAELGREIDMAAVKALFVKKFCTRFDFQTGNGSKHPEWLKLHAPVSASLEEMESMLEKFRLATVCQSARCPNIGECFAKGTATFMILGRRCTRNCRFCAVQSGIPEPQDWQEAERVARVVQELKLKYVVVTSVTRDDLPDGGAGLFVRTIEAVRRESPGTQVEILVPDFRGSRSALETVCAAGPEMFNHNIETVPRLYDRARPQADFQRSLGVLSFAAHRGLRVKSGMMLGLGERDEEVLEALSALLQAGCRYLSMGQYLSPSAAHVPVARYVQPAEFDQWAQRARDMGFSGVAAGPLIRSSYRAEEMMA